MTINSSSTLTPMDFTGMANLRREAKLNNNDDATIKEVALQFEALFVQMALKSMRDAMPKSELLGSDSMDMYQEMHDQQLSMELSRSGGLGLARMIEAQLRGTPPSNSTPPATELKNLGELPITPVVAPLKGLDNA